MKFSGFTALAHPPSPRPRPHHTFSGNFSFSVQARPASLSTSPNLRETLAKRVGGDESSLGTYPLCEWCPGTWQHLMSRISRKRPVSLRLREMVTCPVRQISCHTATEFEPQPVSGSHSYLEEVVDSQVYIITLTWFCEI